MAARRVGKLLNLTKTNDEMKEEYLKGAGELIKWIQEKTEQLNDRTFANTLQDAEAKVCIFSFLEIEYLIIFIYVRPPSLANTEWERNHPRQHKSSTSPLCTAT